jgi:hypothetical protein
MVVSLTATKLKSLMFSVSDFALFYAANMFILMILMTSVCCLHNFVTQLYTYGWLKAICKSRTGVHLGKFPVVWRIFCKHFNFKRQVSATNFQAG